jgi:phage/plasmid-associated DNA primase
MSTKRLDAAQTALLLQSIQRASGLNAADYKPIKESIKRQCLKAKAGEKKKKTVAKNQNALDQVLPSESMDMHLFRRVSEDRKLCAISEAFYEYHPKLGFWQMVHDTTMKQLFQNQSDSSWKWKSMGKERIQQKCGSQKSAESALKYARTKLHVPNLEFTSNAHLRVFANCTVDLRTGEQMAHSPHHYLTSRIDADYRKGAKLPDIFLKFILSSFGEDMIKPIRAGIGMLVDPTTKFGHFLHLIGPTGTGKGAFIRFCQSLFGTGNYGSGGTFNVFAKPETRYQELLGKALYCIPDIAGFQSTGLTEFYELVDDGSLSVRPLFASNAPSIKLGLRFIIGSTDYLPVQDTKGGWGRRSFPLPTRRRKDNESIDNLEANLVSARADVISWALDMDLQERNAILTKPGQSNDRINIVIEESANFADSVRSFADRCLQPKPYNPVTAVTPTVDRTLLWEWYKAYCAATGHRPKGLDAFTSSLKDIIPKHYQPRRRLKASETSKRTKAGIPPMVSPRWVWLEAIPQVFEEIRDDNDKAIGMRCIGHAMRDGQILVFEDWEMSSRDPNHKVDRGQGELIGADRGNEKSQTPQPVSVDRTDRTDRGSFPPDTLGSPLECSSEINPDQSDQSDQFSSGNAFSDLGQPRSAPINFDSPDQLCDLDHDTDSIDGYTLEDF